MQIRQPLAQPHKDNAELRIRELTHPHMHHSEPLHEAFRSFVVQACPSRLTFAQLGTWGYFPETIRVIRLKIIVMIIYAD
jgi:hypothetical protein